MIYDIIYKTLICYVTYVYISYMLYKISDIKDIFIMLNRYHILYNISNIQNELFNI